MEGFHHLDTDHSGELSYGEIKVGIEDLASSMHYTPTAADWDWIKATGSAIDTKNPGSVDEEEFFTFANDVFNHFGICNMMDHGDSGSDATTGPMDHGDSSDATYGTPMDTTTGPMDTTTGPVNATTGPVNATTGPVNGSATTGPVN